MPFHISIFLNKQQYYLFSTTFVFYKSPWIYIPPWMFGAELVREMGETLGKRFRHDKVRKNTFYFEGANYDETDSRYLQHGYQLRGADL